MLTILLNPSNPEPLYQQICTAIREDIAQGVLRPDEKLPSRRALSAHLQTSIVTVQTAYEQLAAEGYLYSRPRAGYFVDPDAPLLAHMPKETAFPSSQPAKTDPDDRIVFSTSGVDLEQFPFATWAKLSRQVLSSKQEKLLQSPPAMGLCGSSAGVSGYSCGTGANSGGCRYGISAGDSGAAAGCVPPLCRGRTRLFQGQTHSTQQRCLGDRCADGSKWAALQQSGASVAHVTPSHQFPTGMIMPVRRRAELLAWASAQTDRYLIEDDYDSELRFLGKPLPSLYSMDTSGHVIYMNTFARTLAPSLRIGYVVLPPPLAKQFEQDFSFYSSSVPCFEQYTLVHFLQEGYFERHLNRMKKTYRQRQKRLTELLRSHPLGAYLHICGEAAGLHLLLEVQLPCTEQELVQAAAAAHVVVYGLSDYYETPQAVPPTPQIVLGYACLSPEELEQGTMRLLNSWLPFLK